MFEVFSAGLACRILMGTRLGEFFQIVHIMHSGYVTGQHYLHKIAIFRRDLYAYMIYLAGESDASWQNADFH